MLTPSHLLQVFEAAGAVDGVVYTSVPITSGLREIKLCQKLDIGFRELRREHFEDWQEHVVKPNSMDALNLATQLRHQSCTLVIDPSRMEVTGWDQGDYNTFWIDVMERYVERLVAAPGWQFSRGARGEVAFALARAIDVRTPDGEVLREEDVLRLDGEARDYLRQIGWDSDEIDAYLCPLVLSRPEASPSAASAVFDWLVRERAYQLAKFGTSLDDEHTLAGLGDDSWWWQQLTNYYHRARVLGLETVRGRQALAKFVATGCGLLESAVRLHGPLPKPGVPSGEIQ